MTTSMRFTSDDLRGFPDDGKRYEIIDGELYVSRQPHYYHQRVCVNVSSLLNFWSQQSQLREVSLAPGLIFADDDDVAPDLIWISNARLATALWQDGKLHSAPELVVEVLSPGGANEQRDREAKLKLYSRRGVHEHWIVDWRARQIEIYRREHAQLRLVATLYEPDVLETPLLPGFSCKVADVFASIRPDAELPQGQ
ncbi:MAG TPA: Uma2 family endonuclease [Blastocatellia bacterium]|nr:Uma2 family endonuclease [Blastocatellia bacterium]